LLSFIPREGEKKGLIIFKTEKKGEWQAERPSTSRQRGEPEEKKYLEREKGKKKNGHLPTHRKKKKGK